jgi:hypothetical protein
MSMPLAMNRTGAVLKKCDQSNHRPGTNKACASGTCQHTCPDIERCGHARTLRYWVNGKQRERSFKDLTDGRGCIQYGSGKRLAADAQLKLTHDKRAEGKTFIDHAKTGRETSASRAAPGLAGWRSARPPRTTTGRAAGLMFCRGMGSSLPSRSRAARPRVTVLANCTSAGCSI